MWMKDVPEKKSGVLMEKRGYGKMAGAQMVWSKDSMIFSIETMPIPIACSMNFVKSVQSIFLIKKLDGIYCEEDGCAITDIF